MHPIRPILDFNNKTLKLEVLCQNGFCFIGRNKINQISYQLWDYAYYFVNCSRCRTTFVLLVASTLGRVCGFCFVVWVFCLFVLKKIILKSMLASENSRNQKHFHCLSVITNCRCSLHTYFIQVWNQNGIKRNAGSKFRFFQYNRTQELRIKWSELLAVTLLHLSQTECKEQNQKVKAFFQ